MEENLHSEFGGALEPGMPPMTNGNKSLGDRAEHMMDSLQGMVEDAFTQCDEPPLLVPPLEEQLENIVMEALTIADELGEDGDGDTDDGTDDEPLGDIGGSSTEEEAYDDPHAVEEAMEELYHGARSSVLAATILIMTLCTIHGVSNKFADQLFTLFRQYLLPSENQLPKNYHAAKTLIKKLGLNYNTIHACQGGCALLRGQYEDATCCPKCKKPRYKDKAQK